MSFATACLARVEAVAKPEMPGRPESPGCPVCCLRKNRRIFLPGSCPGRLVSAMHGARPVPRRPNGAGAILADPRPSARPDEEAANSLRHSPAVLSRPRPLPPSTPRRTHTHAFSRFWDSQSHSRSRRRARTGTKGVLGGGSRRRGRAPFQGRRRVMTSLTPHSREALAAGNPRPSYIVPKGRYA